MKFYNIFFSPTGGTKKVANIVARGTKLDAEEIDLIKEPDKLMKVNFGCNGYVLQCKGRRHEGNSCGGVWKPCD